jgi:hypothetical protein
MSTPQRKIELRKIREAEHEAFLQEEERKAARTMYEQIKELSESEDLKDILHTFATKLGMES